MRVASLVQNPAVRASSQEAPPPTQEFKGTEYHPTIDWWEVGDQRFESTQELIDSVNVPAQGVEATYRYLEAAPPTEKPHVGAVTAGGALAGAAAGAGGTALLMGAGNILGELLYLLTLGFGGRPETLELSARALGIAAGVGATVGGVGALVYNKTSKLPTAEELAGSKSGTIRSEGGQPANTVFYVNNHLKNGVSLTDYAQASDIPAPEMPDPAVSRRATAKRAGIGMASAAVPLIGFLSPALTMGGVGEEAYGVPGLVAGGALGATATAATWGAANQFGVLGWAGAAAASGIVGAGVGWAVGDKVGQNTAVTPGLSQQWWKDAPASY